MDRVIPPLPAYQRRVVDTELDELLTSLPAVSLEGPKAVGKTATARQRASTITQLDDPVTLELVAADPSRVVMGPTPVVIDEWQRYPPSWDLVRRACDEPTTGPGAFILTGSATPSETPTHSGAGRIVPIRIRPLTLPERSVATPTVSLATLVEGGRPLIDGSTDFLLEDYVDEILAGGFPGMRLPAGRARRAALDGYLERIIDSDLPELGMSIRKPATLKRWLQAYAAAISTTTSHEKIRLAAGGAGGSPPAKTTAIPYRDALERLWILDPVPAWSPNRNHLAKLTAAPKHQLADPALAARLLGMESGALLRGEGPDTAVRDGAFLGALFESLCTLSVRVFAQAAESEVEHFRTKAGEREVDLIVVRGDQRVVAIEIKLAATVDDSDVKHLLWLRERLGPDLVDSMVLTTGRYAYRRPDGIAVVPLSLLGA